jgi:hypothetical protein
VLRRERAKRLRFYTFVNVSPKSIVALSEPVPWRPAFKTLLAMATRAGEHTRQGVPPVRNQYASTLNKEPRLRPCERLRWCATQSRLSTRQTLSQRGDKSRCFQRDALALV